MDAAWRVLGDLAWPFMAAAIGTLLGGMIARRRARRPTLPGRPEYVAAIRRLGESRWRYGYLTIGAHALSWRPRSMRPTAAIELAAPVIDQRRGLRWHEQWRLGNDLTVFVVTSRGERYEIAVAPQTAPLMNRIPSSR